MENFEQSKGGRADSNKGGRRSKRSFDHEEKKYVKKGAKQELKPATETGFVGTPDQWFDGKFTRIV